MWSWQSSCAHWESARSKAAFSPYRRNFGTLIAIVAVIVIPFQLLNAILSPDPLIDVDTLEFLAWNSQLVTRNWELSLRSCFPGRQVMLLLGGEGLQSGPH